uniref:Uncharacterized protein n=1 Tax=Cyprinus carpio carpio TaxID=630221 RepID=A0A9J8AWG9_CYPCA
MWALLDIPLRGPRFNSSKVEKALTFSSMDSSAEATMNCSEVKVETSVDKQLEPLLILEEGDEPSAVINSSRGRTVLRVRTADENTKDDIREATEGSSHDHNSVQVGKGESVTMQAEMNEEKNATLESQQEEKEEFFDLLATSQGRRLDDQRAELQNAPSAPPPPLPKAKQRKSSWKIPEVTRTVPMQTPKEDFYNMIVNSQAQGRLEEQRSAAPGPMDDEDFFCLLLKVQGGRMDEQRTELKPVH